MQSKTTPPSKICLPNSPYERNWRDDVLLLIQQGRQDEALKIIEEHKHD